MLVEVSLKCFGILFFCGMGVTFLSKGFNWLLIRFGCGGSSQVGFTVLVFANDQQSGVAGDGSRGWHLNYVDCRSPLVGCIGWAFVILISQTQSNNIQESYFMTIINDIISRNQITNKTTNPNLKKTPNT